MLFDFGCGWLYHTVEQWNKNGINMERTTLYPQKTNLFVIKCASKFASCIVYQENTNVISRPINFVTFVGSGQR